MTNFYADDVAVDAALSLPPQAPQEWPPLPEDAEPEPEPQRAAEPESEDIPEFDTRAKDPFTGLLYVGALTKTFSLYGHSFTIGTPTQTERLQIGQVIDPYANTATGDIAYQTALVAAYLISIDGHKLPEPVIVNPKETALHDRFTWVAGNLRRPVINEIFDRCLELDAQVDSVLDAMGKASG